MKSGLMAKPGRPRRLARLAVRLVLTAERAVLAQLEPVRVVPPVLPRDVVAVLALLTGQCDLGPDVGRSHGGVPFSSTDIPADGLLAACVARGLGFRVTGRTAPAKALTHGNLPAPPGVDLRGCPPVRSGGRT